LGGSPDTAPLPAARSSPQGIVGLGARALLGCAATALAALLADPAVELGALLALRRLAALLADLGVEARAQLRLDGFAALLADPPVELRPILLAHGLAAVFCLVRAGLRPTLTCCHGKHLSSLSTLRSALVAGRSRFGGNDFP